MYSAAPATPKTLPVTSPVPIAAWATLRTIFWVAAPRSSTAAAIKLATSLISRIRSVIPVIDETSWPVEAQVYPIWLAISPVARQICSLSALTSAATTAKSLPVVPARAASIVAFSASKFVCPAMFKIRPTTCPTRETAALSSVS